MNNNNCNFKLNVSDLPCGFKLNSIKLIKIINSSEMQH